MSQWLMLESALQSLEAAQLRGFQPTSEQQAQFDALLSHHAELEAALSSSVEATAMPLPRNMRVSSDGIAEIRIEGVLTPKPDIFAMWFGGGNTTYAQIMAALAIADGDPGIKRAQVFAASPGGRVDGMFEAAAAMAAFKKPMHVRASLAASGAYALIAASGAPIEAVGPASEFGSVGVVQTMLVHDRIVNITSTEAPDKRPDPTTEEGKKVIREFLDSLHELMVQGIAEGRGTTSKKVNQNYGRGALMLADEALRRGMIDSIAKQPPRAARVAVADTAPSGAHVKEESMDANQLKSEHPKVYEAVLNQGIDRGVEQERKRCRAHIKMGESCGDLSIAAKAIRDGADFSDPECQAEYMSVRLNRSDIQTRQNDTDAAGKVLDGTTRTEADDAPETDDDKVAARMSELYGD